MTQNLDPEWTLVFIDPGSSEYEQAREIRFEALYADFGLPRELIEDTDGRTYRHLAAIRDGRVIGYARIHLEDGESKVYQVAVAKDWRGRGVARSLMTELIAVARSLGRAYVHLDAREHVVGMYEGFGFVVDGPEFLSPRTGTPHHHMSLDLS